LLDRFADESPSNAVEVVALKAQLLISLGHYEEGLELYEKAIEYRPDNEGLVLGRADLLLRTGKLDEAIAQYRDAKKRWPDSAMVLNALGYVLADNTEEYVEAEKLIRKALEIDPHSTAIIDSLGWVLYKLGHHEDGLAELQRAYDRMKDPEVASHIVEVLAELDRHDEAIEVLESAEKQDLDNELLKNVRKRYFPDAP
jgi:tetratricopeptide (TPR) repeat protein